MGMNVMSGDQFAADPESAMGGNRGGEQPSSSSAPPPPPRRQPEPEPEPMLSEEEQVCSGGVRTIQPPQLLRGSP